MAAVEQKGGRRTLTDRGLEVWQRWNKLTLTAEGVAIAGGVLFGVPWLLALGSIGAAADVAQIYVINEVQDRRKMKRHQRLVANQGPIPAAA